MGAPFPFPLLGIEPRSQGLYIKAKNNFRINYQIKPEYNQNISKILKNDQILKRPKTVQLFKSSQATYVIPRIQCCPKWINECLHTPSGTKGDLEQEKAPQGSGGQDGTGRSGGEGGKETLGSLYIKAR